MRPVDLREIVGCALALEEGARGDFVGEDPVPHGEDLWVSTDDVLDYAHWIERRVAELDKLTLEAVRTQPPNGPLLGFAGEWSGYVARWRGFLAGLEASWWDRVNAWDRCVVFHQELLGLGDRARAVGIKAPSLTGPPKDQDGLTSLVRDVGSAAALPLTLVVVGLGAAAVLVLAAKK